MKKLGITCLLFTAMSAMADFSWEQVFDVAADAIVGIGDRQCQGNAREIACTLDAIAREMPSVASRFDREDEQFVYEIESALCSIQYEWRPFIVHHARTCPISPMHLRALHAALKKMRCAWYYCRPSYDRCYEYELRRIIRILWDTEAMMRDRGYEAMRDGQCGYLWCLTGYINKVTGIIQRM